MRAPLLLSLGLLLACSGSQRPTCRASDGCRDGEACVTGACVPNVGAGPVTPQLRRLTLAPSALAFVLSEQPDGHPAAAPLGAAVGPRARILLRFDKPAGDGKQLKVARAYLVLERADGAEAGPGEVTVRAQHIVEPWSIGKESGDGAGVTWASPPGAESIAGAEVKVAARGAGPVRVDVTRWMTEWSRKGGKSWGLRVEGEGAGFGLPIATGWAKGAPPRLEVYLQ